MNTRSPQTLASPAFSSTIFCFLIGFFILLVILLVMAAFSVMISLIVVSAVHVICHILQRRPRRRTPRDDIEAGGSAPQLGHDIQSTTLGERDRGRPEGEAFRASTVCNNRQILEMLDRIIRDLGEGRRGSLQREERLREVWERLPPRVRYGSHEMKLCTFAKECVICLEDFEGGDLCQAFPMCNHVFHSDCIGNWLWKNPTCPLCRTCLLESDCEIE